MLDEIENTVLDVLFINRQHSIIRGFNYGTRNILWHDSGNG